MDVETGDRGYVEHLLREDLTEGRNHDQIGRKLLEQAHPFAGTDALGLVYGQGEREGLLLDRTGNGRPRATLGSIGLAEDGEDAVMRVEPREDGDGEIRRPHENDIHRDQVPAFCRFWIFFFIMLRLSWDMRSRKTTPLR